MQHLEHGSVPGRVRHPPTSDGPNSTTTQRLYHLLLMLEFYSYGHMSHMCQKRSGLWTSVGRGPLAHTRVGQDFLPQNTAVRWAVKSPAGAGNVQRSSEKSCKTTASKKYREKRPTFTHKACFWISCHAAQIPPADLILSLLHEL